MNDAVSRMLARYKPKRVEDYVQALREILQEIALLGLWRSKFFEKAAFYGGTSLRLLYGLDRFSEDLDFSLLRPMSHFSLKTYLQALEEEVSSFGFTVHLEKKEKKNENQIQSAFLKADTVNHLMVIQAEESIIRQIPRGQTLKIRLEVDIDPPGGFNTEAKFLLLPIPFSIRTYALPDLFAGKMHALFCRRWKNRVKGRDWYDLVWYATYHPEMHASHLAKRMVQSGHLKKGTVMTRDLFLSLADQAIDALTIPQARKDVEPFIKNPDMLQSWSAPFFRDIVRRIILV